MELNFCKVEDVNIKKKNMDNIFLNRYGYL